MRSLKTGSIMTSRPYCKKCYYCDVIFISTSTSKNHCSLDCSFHDKYRIDNNTGCWHWLGHLSSNGTIIFKTHDISMTAPKYSYSTMKGEIPRGLYVLKSCNTADCVNPDHLFLGKGANEGRISQINKMNRYDEAIKSDKRPNAVICAEYRISESTLRRIRRGEKWRRKHWKNL